MRIYALYTTSIVTGFCILALEIVGGRYLSPRFGTSVDVWAAIISTFVISWSIGSWLGGRVADSARTNAALGWTILLAGVFFLLLPTYASALIDSLPAAVHQSRAGSLVACLILFLPPFVLLGGISPMIVRLIFASEREVGRVTGTLYAISSVGNVLGILVTNYALLALFELNHNTLAMGLILVITGLAHLFIKIETHAVHEDAASETGGGQPGGAAATAGAG